MTDADVAAMFRKILRDQGCRDRGGRCNCMMLCRIDAEEIVAATSEEFRRAVAAIMSDASLKDQQHGD